ncbi:nuclear transport factor 2 family protein [Arthrobacter sp. RCC_34]|uniref:nuclear transport factor 2 family protein n=1 Tax=Arthrobacter sp. RCC_34 TaxID=3239230 RepID=UPI003523AC39
MNTTTTTRDVVDAFFAGFAAGDLDAVKALFAQEFTLTVHGSPRTPWAGTRHRREELDGFFAAFGALGPATEYAIEHLVVDGEHAVAIGRNAFPVTATGKTFTNAFALHFTVTDGLITGYRMHEDSYAIDQAFTAS